MTILTIEYNINTYNFPQHLTKLVDKVEVFFLLPECHSRYCLVISEMENIILLINILKWLLICMTICPCGMLVWKILRRKNLHTLFNLSMCFFFILTGSIFPVVINEYAGLLNGLILHPDVPSPERCHVLHVCRMVVMQGGKVFNFNLWFRYIIIQFSHYGLGLSHSFSSGGTKQWTLKFTYFTLLLFYTGAACFNNIIKTYDVGMMKHIVKGRICLLLR